MAAANPSWSPNLSVAIGFVIIDPNGNVQECTVAGLTGLQPPDFADLNLGDVTQDGSTVEWELMAILAPPTLPAFPLPALPPPSFVNDADGLDPVLVRGDQVAAFENITNRTLYPADPEQLYIDGSAYREVLVRRAIQAAGMQELVAFASFPQLDYLGALVGVKRLPAQPATTIIQFTLANPLSVPFTIAGGTQVGTSDGQFQFATNAALTIPAGATTGSVGATCIPPTAAGVTFVNANGYAPGSVNVLLNPNSLIASVANTATTANGSTPETDAHLRARIQLAPNTFTVAGPSKQYRAIAMGVDPSIVDVLVPLIPATPGVVDAWVLCGPVTNLPYNPASNGGAPNPQAVASAELLDEVQDALSAEDVRPLCDTVNTHPVTEIDYAITATVELFSDADPGTVQAAVNQAALLFANNLAARVQRDIVPEDISAAMTVAGVYRVVMSSPAYTPLLAGQWANCAAINLTFTTSSEHS